MPNHIKQLDQGGPVLRRRLQSGALAQTAHDHAVNSRLRPFGRWRIFEADLRGVGRLDLAGPAMLTIGADGRDEITIHAMQPQPGPGIKPRHRLLPMRRFDEGDEATGWGSAELNDDGTIKVELPYDNADLASAPKNVVSPAGNN